jgi:hypothetical protein
VDKNQTIEELQKEIELLKSQLSESQRKVKEPIREKIHTSHFNKSLVTFVNSKPKQEEFLHRYREVGIKGFPSVCKEFGLSTGLRRSLEIPHSDKKYSSKKLKFLNRIREYESLIEKEHVEKGKKVYLQVFNECKGCRKDIFKKYKEKKLTISDGKIENWKTNDSEFLKKVEELGRKHRDENVKLYINECFERYKQFIKKGLHPLDSIVLCGVGIPNCSFYLTTISQNSNFHEYHKKLLEKSTNPGRSGNKKGDPHKNIVLLNDYKSLLLDLKSNFVIEPKWIRVPDNYTKGINEFSFKIPNYKRIFNTQIKKLINTNFLKIKLQERRIPKWDRLRKIEDLKNKIKLSNDSKRRKNKEKYKYYSTNDIIGYNSFFEDLREQLYKYNSLYVCCENLSVYPRSFRTMMSNQRFNSKVQSIKESVNKEQIEHKIKVLTKHFKKSQKISGKGGILEKCSETIGPSFDFLMKISPEFKQLIYKLEKDLPEKNYNRWMEDSKERYFRLKSKGFNPNDCISLSGFGSRGSSLFKDYIKDNTEFLKEIFDFKKEWKTKWYSSSILNSEQLKEREEYLKNLKRLKVDFENENGEYFKSNDLNFTSWKGFTSYRGGKKLKTFPDYNQYFIIKINHSIRDMERVWKRVSENVNRQNKESFSYMDIIPEEWRKRVKYVSPKGVFFYDVNHNDIFKKCSSCNQVKEISEFFSGTTKGRTYTRCKLCISTIVNGVKRHSSGMLKEKWKNGKLIRRYNEFGKEIERRCNSCDKLKETKLFNHRYKGSSVCDDCYVTLPNNVLTRKREFFKGVHIRWYDEKTYEVVKRRCITCNEVKKKDEFPKNHYSFDGINSVCKMCLYKYRKKRSELKKK